ncbi:thioesterase family protein [Chitinibacter sp. ZOR0017]|uniref:acyl-CoA thioesterase n=1 Tax=Chitinibacter sp. ZOR0017 TaxID=1339254 RepID=UPI001E288BA2|nr:acyl-CoA thioesterase [Chitinibacter sp. ZOR0017]
MPVLPAVFACAYTATPDTLESTYFSPMARFELSLPTCDLFFTELTIRIRDINYGGHLSNDALLALLHEARLQWLKQLGYADELDVGGKGLIMTDVAICFRQEVFHGQSLQIALGCAEVGRASFDLYYDVTQEGRPIAQARTGMAAFDYQRRKISSLPTPLRTALEPRGITP